MEVLVEITIFVAVPEGVNVIHMGNIMLINQEGDVVCVRVRLTGSENVLLDTAKHVDQRGMTHGAPRALILTD